MQPKRTKVDFSKHIIETVLAPNYTVHYFHRPNTGVDAIEFINTRGIMVVIGDYSNWVFCREFHPAANECVSDGYWIEKLRNSSKQDPYNFDADIARKEIDILLNTNYHDFDDAEREWLNELKETADDGEYSFIAKCMEHPSSFDTELMPHAKKVDYHLEVVFDAFDEICRRMKESEKAKEQ